MAGAAVLALTVFAFPTDSVAAVAPGRTERVSVGADGHPVNQFAINQSTSDDGRYVVFEAAGTDDHGDPLSGGGTDGRPPVGPGTHNEDGTQVDNRAIYVRDLKTGQTSLVSIGINTDVRGSPRVEPANGNSILPSISPNGRYVSFVTSAPNIEHLGAEPPAQAVVVCDRSVQGLPADGVFTPPPSTNGAYPQFGCIVEGTSSGGIEDVGAPRLGGGYVDASGELLPLRIVWSERGDGRDFAQSGAMGQDPLVHTDNDNFDFLDVPAPVDGVLNSSLDQPSISPDASAIVVRTTFFSNQEGVDDVHQLHLFPVRGDTIGDPVQVDKAPGTGFVGSATLRPSDPRVSNGGRRVVFDAQEVEPTTLRAPQVFAVDASDPADLSSVLVSVDRDGGPGDGITPAVSSDGRYIAFVTDVPKMTDSDEPGETLPANCIVGFPIFFRRPAAAPRAAADAPPDTRTTCQVVARDLAVDLPALQAGNAPGPAQLVSRSTGADALADKDATGPLTVSAAGAEVSFVSDAGNLDDITTNGTEGEPANVYVHTFTPELTADPLDLGEVEIGTNIQQALTLTLAGFGPFTLGGITLGGDDPGDFQLGPVVCQNGGGTVVHVDTPCTVPVTFAPSAEGIRSATVEIADADPAVAQRALIVAVSGTGTTKPVDDPGDPGDGGTPPEPAFSADPTVLAFGTQLPLLPGGTTRTATITNRGTGPLRVTSARAVETGPPGVVRDYTVDATDCSAPVAPGRSCRVTVTFVGHAVGNRGAALLIRDNAPGGRHVIRLAARVAPPKLLLGPSVTPSGHAITAVGVGFAPGQDVELAVPEMSAVTTVTPEADGSFSVDLLVLRGVPLGPTTVTASTPGVSRSISDEQPLLVVPGSQVDPGIFNRH